MNSLHSADSLFLFKIGLNERKIRHEVDQVKNSI